MSEQMVRQTMFSTGEVDEITWKRTDVEQYLTAAQSLKNCEVGTTSLVKKRKGSEFLLNATAYSNPNSRMYDFVDKNEDHYLLISADQKFTVFDAPTESQNVVVEDGTQVVTIRGNNVVAYEEGLPFVQSINTPYLMTDLDRIDYTQDQDSLILTHPNYAPGRIYVSSYTGSTPTFAFEYLNIYPLPAYDFNNINYNDFTVALSLNLDTPPSLVFKFTGIGANPGYNTDWVGGQIIGGGTSPTSPLGYAIITDVSYNPLETGGTVTFVATIQIAFDTNAATYAKKGSQYSIRQPAWSAALGYPAKVLFFQNRLWFGNTASLNNTVFASKINSPINFDVGVGGDTDAIVYTIGQNDSGSIQWLNGGKQLEIYCQNYEFACPQDQNTALTPSTFSVRQQTSFGSSPLLKPVTYINDSYYLSKTGKALVNFHFNGVGLTYVASNVSVASSHLAKNPTNRALIRGSDTSQDNFIYFLNPDNTLTVFQFANEYKLAALTPAVFQDDVTLVDIVTIANDVYLLKKYNKTDIYAVEHFNDDIKIDSQRSASMDSSGVVNGLSMFNGYTVQVIYQNQDFGEYLVSGGTITVFNPLEVSGAVEIGLLYDVEIFPMFAYAGSSAAPFMKNVSRVYVDYYQSLDFYINGKLIPYQNFADIQAGLPLQPQTDTAILGPVSGWSRFDNSMIKITQSSPFDLQILSIAYQIEMAVI